MSRIEDLIQDLCPEGVMYFPLTSVARIDRGLTYQKSDEDPNGSIAVLRSNNIDQASNTISLTDVKKLRSDLTPNPKTRLSVGDILISAASGSATHVGKVAFIARDPEAYFGGFMMAVRSGNLIENSYLFHILTSRLFRDYLDQTLSSSTINNINAAVLDGFKLPVPPLEVQKEIVSILDKFTQLEAELEAELEARRFQFEATRDRLLDFSGDLDGHPLREELKTFFSGPIPHLKLSEVGVFTRGNGLEKKDLLDVGKPAVHYGEVHTHYGFWTKETKSFISDSQAKKIRKADPGDIVIVTTSENQTDVGKPLAWLGNEPLNVGGECYIFKSDLDPFFACQVLMSSAFKRAARKFISGTKVKRISSDNLGKIEIPVPPLAVQEKVGIILADLDTLLNDVTIGIPGEIEARRKQYEYYRNKLLTFTELETL